MFRDLYIIIIFKSEELFLTNPLVYLIKFCCVVITSPGVNNFGILSPVINELFTLFDASRILIVVVMIQKIENISINNDRNYKVAPKWNGN